MTRDVKAETGNNATPKHHSGCRIGGVDNEMPTEVRGTDGLANQKKIQSTTNRATQAPKFGRLPSPNPVTGPMTILWPQRTAKSSLTLLRSPKQLLNRLTRHPSPIDPDFCSQRRRRRVSPQAMSLPESASDSKFTNEHPLQAKKYGTCVGRD